MWLRQAQRVRLNGDAHIVPIPSLDAHGLLPAGVHDYTLMEIEAVFAGNAHRRRLYRGFASCFKDELRGRIEGCVMGGWVKALEAKARIIHSQLAAARKLAEEAGLDPDDVAQPYLDLINDLYRDECQFAQLVDDADLIVRYSGPAISLGPTMSMFTSVCRDLRSQIQGVAKAIFGLSVDEPHAAARGARLRWPSALDPLLSGLAHGSLVVGVRIQSPEEDARAHLTELAGVSDSIVESVRTAVKNIATVSRHVGDRGIDEDAIQAELPDPAIRDTVLVAAAKLAPTGRKQYKSVSFYSKGDATGPARELTPASRRILNRAIDRPVRTNREGSFEGVAGRQPRLIAVSSLEVLERPAQQSEMVVGSR